MKKEQRIGLPCIVGELLNGTGHVDAGGRVEAGLAADQVDVCTG